MSTQPQLVPQAPNPYEGITGAIPLTQVEQTEHLKVAIIGPPKNGKSWFAATAPGNKLVYDFDDRLISLAGKPNIQGKTLRDTQSNPTVVKALETDISNFQYRKAKGLPIPDTFIFDTVSNLISNGIKNEYLRNNPKDGRSFRMGGTMVQIGISYDLLNTTNGFLNYLLTEYNALGNVIFVFHERDEKDKAESKPNEIKYTGLITIEPQFAANILTYFNEVFRIKVNWEGKYSVSCKPNQEVTASTTLLLDATEPPDLMAMIMKHRQRKAEQDKLKLNQTETKENK